MASYGAPSNAHPPVWDYSKIHPVHLWVSILSNISHPLALLALQFRCVYALLGWPSTVGVRSLRPHSLILPLPRPLRTSRTSYSWVSLVPSSAVYAAHSRRAMVVPPRRQHPRPPESHCTSSMVHAQCRFRTVATRTISARFSRRPSTLAPAVRNFFLWSQRLGTGARGAAQRNRPRCSPQGALEQLRAHREQVDCG